MSRNHSFAVLFLIFVVALFPPNFVSAQSSILGFTPASAASEAEVESKFKSIPTPDEERRQHRIFTAEPHIAGSKRNNELADYIASEWRKQGLEDVVIRRYDVYGTNPKSASLEMLAPVHYAATLREAPIPGDDDSKNPAISGAWLGMSISGEVTAPVVYAHSGNPEDYDLLRKNGISVKGKIVLVRYSNPYSYRGFKALTAQREGAAAILIYSDPQEDGYTKGKVDPDGPWGPEYKIQHGAITYDFMVPGDPTTPGWASIPGAKRIPIEQAVSAPKIMALPLSWHDAKPLLENMDGPVAPADWQGGLRLPLSPRRRSRESPSENRNGQRPSTLLRRRRTNPRRRPARRMGRARQSPRRLGLRRSRSLKRHRIDDGTDPRPRPTRERRHAPAPHHHCLQLGRRRSRPHRLDRMGRAIRRRTSRQSRRLHQRRRSHVGPQFPRPGRRLARAHAGRDDSHACRIPPARVSTTRGKQTAAREKAEGTNPAR